MTHWQIIHRLIKWTPLSITSIKTLLTKIWNKTWEDLKEINRYTPTTKAIQDSCLNPMECLLKISSLKG